MHFDCLATLIFEEITYVRVAKNLGLHTSGVTKGNVKSIL